MSYLILGLILFLGAHSVRFFAEGWRTQTLQRLGLQARVLVADAAALASWWDGQCNCLRLCFLRLASHKSGCTDTFCGFESCVSQVGNPLEQFLVGCQPAKRLSNFLNQWRWWCEGRHPNHNSNNNSYSN